MNLIILELKYIWENKIIFYIGILVIIGDCLTLLNTKKFFI